MQQELLSTSTGEHPAVDAGVGACCDAPVVLGVRRRAGAVELRGVSTRGETFMGTCPDCGSQLEYAEGCVKCHVCGFRSAANAPPYRMERLTRALIRAPFFVQEHGICREVMQMMEIHLGFAYVPGSIRARLDTIALDVEEQEPERGTLRVDVHPDVSGEISIEYTRRILQGGGPRPTRIIGIANACIYCGATSGLSDEHVIPFALEGEFVLRNASCKACGDKTSRIELKVLREGYSHLAPP